MMSRTEAIFLAGIVVGYVVMYLVMIWCSYWSNMKSSQVVVTMSRSFQREFALYTAKMNRFFWRNLK